MLMGDVPIPIRPGVVYILGNSAYRETVVKIGRSSRSGAERATELSRATGVPLEFKVLYEEMVSDCARAEKLVHERLAKFRINSKREFFDVPPQEAYQTVLNACLSVNSKFTQERSRLAIWLKPETDYITDFLEWIESCKPGNTSLHVIREEPRARSNWFLSNTLLIACTPNSLFELKAKPWVHDLVFVSKDQWGRDQWGPDQWGRSN